MWIHDFIFAPVSHFYFQGFKKKHKHVHEYNKHGNRSNEHLQRRSSTMTFYFELEKRINVLFDLLTCIKIR